MYALRLIVKVSKFLKRSLAYPFDYARTVAAFVGNGVRYRSFKTRGAPVINVNLKGTMTIGGGFLMNNGRANNMIGRQQPCYFIVGQKAVLTIGDNVAISASSIVCQRAITIGDNVRIGGNTVIYDTDFHNLDYHERIQVPENYATVVRRPVVVGNNVFIGAHSTILKGVTIGDNAIIGAGSVVTRSVPPDEIWGGNPAVFLKKTSRPVALAI